MGIEWRYEMKIRKLFAIALFTTAITTAMFADNVTVDYDHAANFKQIKTYSWSNVKTANSIWDQRVKDAIEQQLATKGWMQVASGGDVNLIAVEKTSVQQQYDTFYNGFGGWRRRGGISEATTTVDNYRVGTLVVSVFDAKSKNLIWQGTSSSDLSGNPDKNTKALDKDVQKMFKKFPPSAAA
jgi:ribosome recycling factor